MRLLKARVNLRFLVNPFYLYCIGFSLAIAVYLAGWSRLFPDLSAGLILFFVTTFIIFIIAGKLTVKKEPEFLNHKLPDSYLKEIAFCFIIFLGVLNIIYMGYIPVLDRAHNYREFGMPVIDPVFNTLSIFFSVIYFRAFLDSRNKRFLVFVLIILAIQLIIFRRSTVIWILTSSSLLYLFYRKLRLYIVVLSILCIPLMSYSFGLYGNYRSKLKKSFILNDLGASDRFIEKGLSYNHYMTYLYVSSPLANLQENINRKTPDVTNAGLKSFIFYCLIPESFTIRLEKPLHLSPPVCYLITPELIAGTIFMTSYYTLGWSGMIIMFLYLTCIILLCLWVIKKWPAFGLETFSILCATACLIIFSNFLNRLDVILMLFIYPVLFHLISEIKPERKGVSL